MASESEPFHHFMLFIAGDQNNSLKAQKNIKRFFEKHMLDRHELIIVDVIKNPKMALEKGVYFTPMLIMAYPDSETSLAGDMSDEKALEKLFVA